MAMLEVKDLHVYYGVIQALKGISFEVNQGEVIALIGANGAGKTTTLQTLTGLLSAKEGSVVFEGKDITKVPAHKIVEMGIAHVPEGRRVFADLSVYENLIMGAYTRKDKAEIQESLAGVYKRFPRLEERKGQRAGTLSGGEQQMLAMGRALMSKPRLIIMDEPSMGLSPIFVNEIFDIIRVVSEGGTTVLLVEQNAKKALSIADRAYVLETGKITMSGKAEDLLNDEAVQKAYLGEKRAAVHSGHRAMPCAAICRSLRTAGPDDKYGKMIRSEKVKSGRHDKEERHGQFRNYNCETVWKRRANRRGNAGKEIRDWLL